ncbi:hypothetical protein SAMN05443637_104236 [Pseudonocardia thermophila]|jgi:hypothetical protein|uniref:Uncharacterized protein n=1 Tax=Pseudonocardia thermophila TaxID=1848 RepID=A0A1M6R8A3_PSETH|nr:SCO5389 family protein [Pseudonocardia thermophila]SHK28682.1 hypothetical protein SAMN05443637_104236 [Pseudonocardia thermophila]
MSLDVPADVLASAERGELTDEQFLAVVRESLPYAWEVVTAAVENGEHSVPPPSEAHRGQLLRALASTSIRTALERHFGVALAFQNCHKVGAFPLDQVGGAAYQEFISPRAQILNQTPQLRDC